MVSSVIVVQLLIQHLFHNLLDKLQTIASKQIQYIQTSRGPLIRLIITFFFTGQILQVLTVVLCHTSIPLKETEFSMLRFKVTNPQMFCATNGAPLIFSICHTLKDLGVIYDTKLSFATNIDTNCMKVTKLLGFIIGKTTH